MQIIRSIQNRIYEIRGEKVMLDFDLADLFEVGTKVLNQAVKRNIKRFPKDFMFQLAPEEWESIRSQIVTTSFIPVPGSQNVILDSKALKPKEKSTGNWSQIVTSSRKHRRKSSIPYAFNEQGVSMISGVLNSDIAINMHIAIMRAFVEIRRILLLEGDIKEQLRRIQDHINDHDIQLSSIYEAIENLLDETIAKKKWEERERVGFKK
jgi:hypothetical protein